MSGPKGVLWAKIIRRKNIISIKIIGIIHQSLFFQRNASNPPVVIVLVFIDRINPGVFI